MYSQGDIVLVPVPFTDLSSHKKRPVLVLSKSEYNSVADDVIVAAITSVIDTKPYTVLFTDDDMADGTLRIDSCVRADKIYTLSQELIIKRFGRVNSEVVETVKERLFSIMADTPQELNK